METGADPRAWVEQMLRARRFAEAAASCDAILNGSGSDKGLLNDLGLLAVRAEQVGLGLRLFDRSLEIDPVQPSIRYYQGCGRLALEDAAGAIASFDEARRLGLETAEVHHRRGDALQQLGRHAEAVQCYDLALQRNPGLVGARNNRGTALLALSRHEAAMDDFREALAREPTYARAWSNLSRAQREFGLPNDALASANRALTSAPADPGALTNCGCALWDLGRREEALACYERALQSSPDFPPALSNMASALQDMKRDSDAVGPLERLLAVAPHWKHARANLLWSRMRCCDWSGYDAEVSALLESVAAGSNVVDPFQLLSMSDSATLQLACARVYARSEFSGPTTVSAPLRSLHRDRIRVAYLSADFRQHAVAFLLAGLIERHDRERYEIVAVTLRPVEQGPLGRRLERAFDRTIDVSRANDAHAAEQIRQLELDILVDLGGYTAGSRTGILTRRPAPLQVNYLGYPGTLGIEAWDYIIADDYVVPDALTGAYGEQVVRLPDCFQVNDAARHRSGDPPTRAEEGLPHEAFVYCCFNNLYKVVPALFDRWMRILRARPGSVLWLIADNVRAVENLRREAQQRGVEPARLVFGRRLSYERHLDRIALADLFLDTLPFNAGTTASDALWAGVPVLTCSGQAFAARMAGSLLRTVGLPELIVPDLDTYEATALRLAEDTEALGALRARLAANRYANALFDTDRFRRHIEFAYATMVERHRQGNVPASFRVPLLP